jgi:hypothetical protein
MGEVARGRVRVSRAGGRWRDDRPTPGQVVEVWWVNGVILGVWDGVKWKTVDGSVLDGVSHWRVR